MQPVRWAEGPPAPDPLPHLPLAAPKSTRGFLATLTGTHLVGAWTHWTPPNSLAPNGKRWPCTAPQCEACGRGFGSLRYWWIGACLEARPTHWIAELTEAAAIQLTALAPDPHSLRGLTVRIRRADARKGARVVVALEATPFELPFELPAPIDVRPHLERYWGAGRPCWSASLPDWTPDGRAVKPQVRRGQP